MLSFTSQGDADTWASQNASYLKAQEQRVRRMFKVRGIRLDLVRHPLPARILGLDGRGKPIIALKLAGPRAQRS